MALLEAVPTAQRAVAELATDVTGAFGDESERAATR